ncbi:hypothetical protein AB6A40_005131 [Gnathostoma spinigerum]|uniref:Caspase family p10 domain-containing protein n=1 Tax=Gnathostoma spinigerum TaxID=75299 RepID=A0ABD6EP19_9BILA
MYDRGYQCGDSTDGIFDNFFSRQQSQRKVFTRSEAVRGYKSPLEADVLVSYATAPGYVSWRNSMKGSWFIQSICEVFAKFSAKDDILTMLTLVNKKVAESYESSSGAYKQIPDHSSRLRRQFYFFPGISKH